MIPLFSLSTTKSWQSKVSELYFETYARSVHFHIYYHLTIQTTTTISPLDYFSSFLTGLPVGCSQKLFSFSLWYNFFLIYRIFIIIFGIKMQIRLCYFLIQIPSVAFLWFTYSVYGLGPAYLLSVLSVYLFDLISYYSLPLAYYVLDIFVICSTNTSVLFLPQSSLLVVFLPWKSRTKILVSLFLSSQVSGQMSLKQRPSFIYKSKLIFILM